MSVSNVYQKLDSQAKGLTQFEANIRLNKFGPNEIAAEKKVSDWVLFFQQFKNFLVFILIVAAIISAILGEFLDAGAILAIVIINSILGFYQERKAEQAVEALKKLAAPKATVIRDGETKIIPATEVVPGDVILLKVGDRVPADARIVEELNLKCDESALTGESTPVEKAMDVIKKDVAVAERTNMIFSGTIVVYGHCKAIVVETGMSTEFGKIAKMLEVEDEQTPLQKRLETLGKQLSLIILVIVGIVFVAGFLRGGDPAFMFLTAVALAVAAIPEGLPAIVTITLSIGLQRLASKNAIIRRLSAAETLGSTTVVCSDKTGTLTVNEMTVRKLYVNDMIIDVTGEGYDTQGKFLYKNKEIQADEGMQLLLGTGLLCNDAQIKENKEVLGDPTEAALIVSAKKAGLEDLRQKYKRTDEISFTSERKMMSVLCEVDGRRVVYVKGAVEEILKKCSTIYSSVGVRKISEDDKRRIIDTNNEFAKNALRVLGFAVKRIEPREKLKEEDLMFVGLQGMIDPPRKEVKDAIALCKKAGIKAVMITGDHKETAAAVARELEMIDKTTDDLQSSSNSKVLTGLELDAMSNDDFENIVEDVVVYARVSPEHKVRITDALKKKGHIVAMTGDGVNDAPALKKADIGIAMGITGTDVSKEASDMILTDDDFSTIVAAVEEGRGIYDNVKKFVNYLLSCNVGEVATIFTSILIGLPLPLLPLQLLWMNLITDGLPALALGVEPKEKDIMLRKPRNPKEKVLTRESFRMILLVATIVTAGTILLFYFELPNGIDKARTIAFTTIIMFQMFVALGLRSNQPLLKTGIFSNRKLIYAILSSVFLQLLIIYTPVFGPIFDVVPLDVFDWIAILGVSITVLIALELRKYIILRKKK